MIAECIAEACGRGQGVKAGKKYEHAKEQIQSALLELLSDIENASKDFPCTSGELADEMDKRIRQFCEETDNEEKA